MDVAYHFEQTWLYDLYVNIYGPSNFCSLVHDEKKVKLAPMRNVSLPDTKRPDASSSKNALNLISLKSLDKEITKESTIIFLVAREITNDFQEKIHFATVPIMKEFSYVFPKELSDNLPLMRDIQHDIDLVSGATLSNLPLLQNESGRATQHTS